MIVTLTPKPDFSPVPRVEISLDEEVVIDGGEPGGEPEDTVDGGEPGEVSGDVLDGGSPFTISVSVPDGTDSVTLWRTSEGRSMKVRGAVGRSFAGVSGWVDLEAGLDVESLYVADCFEDGVLLGRVSLGAVVLPWLGDPNGVVVQQPLDPRLNVTITNLEESWPELTNDAPSELLYAEGAEYPIMVGAGPRRGFDGVAVDFGVGSIGDARALRGTLGAPGAPQLQAWLVRSPAGFLPRVFFARVGQLTQIDVDYRFGDEWSRFQASVTEIEPPAPALVLGVLSYDDLDVSFLDYDAMDAAFVSYSERDTAWDYTGAAGGV